MSNTTSRSPLATLLWSEGTSSPDHSPPGLARAGGDVLGVRSIIGAVIPATSRWAEQKE